MPTSLQHPCDTTIFGAFGDLALRKLFPALYQLDRAGLISDECRIIGAARRDSNDQAFAELVLEHMKKHIKEHELETDNINRFLARIRFVKVDIGHTADYVALKGVLNQQPSHQRIFYFATAASLYGQICQDLKEAGCYCENSRVVLEKPIGHDLDSSGQVNEDVAKIFNEDQTYRIDHYLGKETVQNLIALRFANNLFSSQWDHSNISHVEISVAEQVGIEGRWGYFDKAGQLRDMVQNHLLQLLCLITMDPPNDLSAEAIRNEKIKVLKALRPIDNSMIETHAVRGQYSNGNIQGKPVPGYLEEPDANQESDTETFVAIKAEINNWRWASVPFYIRTGKRLPEKNSKIVIHFKQSPHYIFDQDQKNLVNNKLIIQLQPEEGIMLDVLTKEQGLDKGMRLRTGPLHLDFSEAFKSDRIPDAYERLLFEVMKGNQNLFVHREEIKHAWVWCDRIIEGWKQSGTPPKRYPAGSWGPTASIAMITQDGRSWYEDN